MAFCNEFRDKIVSENPCLAISVGLIIVLIGVTLISVLIVFSDELISKYVIKCESNEHCGSGLTLLSIFAIFCLIVICLLVIKAWRYKNERNAHTTTIITY
jgi:heme/copper-type cytochrome/quinol oxidase subunit 2